MRLDDSELFTSPFNGAPIPPTPPEQQVALTTEQIEAMLDEIMKPATAQKQADRVKPVGQPLEPWGDREVEITPEDVARAILEFNERVPEAAGALMAEPEE